MTIDKIIAMARTEPLASNTAAALIEALAIRQRKTEFAVNILVMLENYRRRGEALPVDSIPEEIPEKEEW